MTPDRWRQISRVYAAVSGVPTAARATTLAALCGNDRELQREVESLLDAEPDAVPIDRPIGGSGAPWHAPERDLVGRMLGPYRLDAAIGAGGMGQVYRATDTRLNRIVAVKLLAPSLANDPQFRSRFAREAKAIAALNHPDICSLFDVGRDDHEPPLDFLVMEHVEGETLATRLERGALPLREALTTAAAIAGALAAAHRQGIVHRDLKPGNVMLTKHGAKLLDFGLAKAPRPSGIVGSLSKLPTAAAIDPGASAPLTAEGAILGTLHYMAPEQLEGKEADARSDLFTFGAMLYEMLAGKRAFSGATPASVIGAIMHGEPPALATIQPLTPPALDRLVRACLEKDPEARWESAADLQRELHWIAAASTDTTSVVTPRGRWRVATLIVAAMTGAILALGARSLFVIPSVEHSLARFTIAPPPNGVFGVNPGGLAPAVSVSPNGHWIAYAAFESGNPQRIWIRPIDSVESHPLPGTEGGRYPFWSPDSRSLAFFTQVALKRIDIAGGAPRVIADIPDGAGGAWTQSRIVFGTISRGLFTVGDEGGAINPLRLRGDHGQGRLPSVLPDGTHFLYWDREGETSEGNIRAGSLDAENSDIVVPATHGLAWSADHLLFVRGHTLFAQPFDVGARKTRGPAVAIEDGLATSGISGYASLAASDKAGVLVFGRSIAIRRQPRWIDRTGAKLEAVGGEYEISGVRLSVDGRLILFVRPEQTGNFNAIWAHDAIRHTESKIVLGVQPVISPDGAWIAYTQMPNANGIARIRSDGSGQSETLVPRTAWPTDWSPDGSRLLFQSPEAKTGMDLSILDLETRRVTPLLNGEMNEAEGRFSPDGRLVAYTTDRSGRQQVWVQSLSSGERVQVSTGEGGSEPRWRRKGEGNELFYLANDRWVVAASITVATGHLTVNSSTPLFQVDVPVRVPLFAMDYEPSADGRRFLVSEFVGPLNPPALTVVLNWTELLKTPR